MIQAVEHQAVIHHIVEEVENQAVYHHIVEEVENQAACHHIVEEVENQVVCHHIIEVDIQMMIMIQAAAHIKEIISHIQSHVEDK